MYNDIIDKLYMYISISKSFMVLRMKKNARAIRPKGFKVLLRIPSSARSLRLGGERHLLNLKFTNLSERTARKLKN